MQASYAGPLASYNSLTDEHLSGYFSNPRTFRHLRRMGLVTRDGRIVEEGIIRVNNARKEHKARSKGVLANSIVNKAIEIERKRRSDLKRKLDLLEKYEIVEKVKSQKRHPSGIQEFNPYRTVPPPPPRLSTTLDMHFDKLSLSLDQISDMRHLVGRISRDRSVPNRRAKSPYEEDLTSRYSTPVPRPPTTPRPSTSASVGGRRSTIRSRPSTAPARVGPRRSTLRSAITRSQPMHSNVSITLKFIGTGLHLESTATECKPSEVMVVQQHCGGNTVTLYRGRVKPKDVFTFVSKRHIGMPYGLTIYLDGMMDSRVSACCEYRHQCGRLLGSKTAHFKLVNVEGGKPCYRCEIERNKKYLKERQDQELDRVLGGTLSLQELATPQASANNDEEPPLIDNSPFHSGSETSQEDAADRLPKTDTLNHKNSPEPEELSEVADKTSLDSHSHASIVSSESLKSMSSRVSVASSKSSIHSRASSASKASSRSSKSSKHSVPKNSSPSSSHHSLTDREEETEQPVSKVSVDEYVKDGEKHLSDHESAETADVEDEYNYADDKFEELIAEDPQHSPIEKQPGDSDEAVVLSKEERLSGNEHRETETTNDESGEVWRDEAVEDKDQPEIEEIIFNQSEAAQQPDLDERPPSPLVEESVASEEASVPVANNTEKKDNENVNSESEATGSNSDVADHQNKSTSSISQSDPSNHVEDTSPSQQDSNTLDKAAESGSDADSVAQAEDEDKTPADGSVLLNEEKEPTQTEELRASLKEPTGDAAPEEMADDHLPVSDNVEETQLKSQDTTDEAPKEREEEENTTQQGILLTSSKRSKQMRLSVSFDDKQNDDQSSKDLSASLTIEEAKKVLQKSQSNVSLGSLLNSEVASSVDLNATDDDDIPDLERKISDLIDDGGSVDKTKSQESTDTVAAGKDANEEGADSEQTSQETSKGDDIHTSSQTDMAEETKETEDTLAKVTTDQNHEANTESDHQQVEDEHKSNTMPESAASSVESGLSSSSSKSSLTSVSSQNTNS